MIVYRESNKEKIKTQVALSLCFLFFIINSISFFIYGEGTELGFQIMGGESQLEINDFKIVDVGEIGKNNPKEEDELTPALEYGVIIDIENDAGIGNLTEVAIKFWYDATGNSNEQNDFNSQDLSITNGAIVTWNYDGNFTSVAIDAHKEETSWEINIEESRLPDKAILEDSGETEFEFVFIIRVGKIARETSVDARWQVGVMVTDKSGALGYRSIYRRRGQNIIRGVSMNWYGQMYSPEAIDWGRLIAGIDFDDESARAKVEGIEFISNGTFDYEIRSDRRWESEDGERVEGTDDASGSNEFALRISTEDVFNDSAQIVNFHRRDFNKVEEDLPPNESYENIKENYLYLRVNEDFPESKNFIGNIVYSIVNET